MLVHIVIVKKNCRLHETVKILTTQKFFMRIIFNVKVKISRSMVFHFMGNECCVWPRSNGALLSQNNTSRCTIYTSMYKECSIVSVSWLSTCCFFTDGNSRKRPLDEVGHIGLWSVCLVCQWASRMAVLYRKLDSTVAVSKARGGHYLEFSSTVHLL